MKHLDFLMEDFKNIQELIRFIDQKANFLLVILGAIVTLNIGKIEKIDLYNMEEFETADIILFAMLVLIVVELFILIFGILKPRSGKQIIRKFLKKNWNRITELFNKERKKKPENKESSLFFYGEIKKMEYGEFKSKMKNLSKSEGHEETMLYQIHTCSKIANKKTNWYRFASIIMFGIIALNIGLYLF